MQFNNNRFLKRYGPLTLVSLALIGALIWGGIGWARQRSLERTLLNTYTRSFYELVGGMDTLENLLSKVIVSGSQGKNVDLLSNISRQTSTVMSNLSGLPLSHAALLDTMRFVNQLGDFCESLKRSAGDGMPLSTENVESLISLHNVCVSLSDELGQLQQQGIDFTPIEPGAWLDGAPLDSIFQGLGQDDTGATQYPALIYDGPFSEGLQQQTPQGLGEGVVDEEGARMKAAEFLNLSPESVRVASESQGKIQGVMLEADKAGTITRLVVTLQGGRVQWMMEESDSAEVRLTPEQCIENARAELARQGYTDLAVTWTQQYDGVLIINFAYSKDDVTFYPDLVKARVRMDDGTLCGLDATGWLMNHHDRHDVEPALSAEEAQKLVSPLLEIETVQLAVIPTEGGGENLCWEFKGKFGGDTFFVYIDSVTGKEANIFRVINTSEGSLIV